MKKIIGIILFILPITFIFFSDKIFIGNKSLNNVFLMIASILVVGTVYFILEAIFKKNPNFLGKGIWKNPFNLIIIGTFLLFALSMTFLLLFNTYDLSKHPNLNRSVTFLLAYPTVFVLEVMVIGFYKILLPKNSGKDLLVKSSYTILLILLALLLFN
ncbi:hypothetical protein AB4Y30_03535 [Ornithinibacillus sp. 4-3]|uniref:Uncharacterized protein n=1 Tax=Ornithinibacillus sp. 4-3 TaxID=3231488 RepID=A0AB39HTW6_9BACI